jgi:chemotaxis protein MotC
VVRSLQALQDSIAQGDVAAHRAQRGRLAQIAEQMTSAAPEVWKDPRNARAVVAFVLSGGDARVLRRLSQLGALAAVDEKLVNGALAYGEGRTAEAETHFAGLDARSLDASIAGHVALVKSELTAGRDPKAALALLDEARLLAPGTLIEEAALRRQIALAAAAKDFEAFDLLATNYLRRFGRSVYAAGFRRQFAADVAGREDAGSAARMTQLATALEAIGASDARDVYLALAREAVTKGKVELAQFAADRVAGLVAGETVEARLVALYRAAALVVTDGFDRAMAALESMDRSDFPEEDAALFDAARSVAAEVRRMPPQPTTGQAPEGAGPLPEVVATARRRLALADEIIRKASQ